MHGGGRSSVSQVQRLKGWGAHAVRAAQVQRHGCTAVLFPARLRKAETRNGGCAAAAAAGSLSMLCLPLSRRHGAVLQLVCGSAAGCGMAASAQRAGASGFCSCGSDASVKRGGRARRSMRYRGWARAAGCLQLGIRIRCSLTERPLRVPAARAAGAA